MKDRMCRAVEERLSSEQWDCAIALQVASKVKGRRKRISHVLLAILVGGGAVAVGLSRLEQAVAQIAAADASEALEGTFSITPAEQSVSTDVQLIVQTTFVQ